MSRFQAQTNAVLDQELEDLRQRHLTLSEAKVERLAEVLDRGFEPTPALRAVLKNLASPKRRPPPLRWKEV